MTATITELQARGRLRYVAGLFGGGLALSGLYAATGVGLPCPFRALTGWECPLCGGTRMGAALLRGDLAAAFGFNPVALVGLTLVGVLGCCWLVAALGGPVVRLPASWSRRLAAVRPTAWLVAGAVLSAAYVLLRNLS